MKQFDEIVSREDIPQRMAYSINEEDSIKLEASVIIDTKNNTETPFVELKNANKDLFIALKKRAEENGGKYDPKLEGFVFKSIENAFKFTGQKFFKPRSAGKMKFKPKSRGKIKQPSQLQIEFETVYEKEPEEIKKAMKSFKEWWNETNW